MLEFDFGQGADGREIFRRLDEQTDAGSFGVTQRGGDLLQDSLRQIACQGRSHGAIAKNERDAKAACAGAHVKNVSGFELRSKRPAIPGRDRVPLFAGDAFGCEPGDELFPDSH